MQRRPFLKASLALAALGLPGARALAEVSTGMAEGQGRPFSFEQLQNRARKMAQQAWHAPSEKLPQALTRLTPQQFHKIHMPNAKGLWADQPALDFEVVFSHVGMHFDTPVRMHVVDPKTSQAYRIPFQPGLFDYSGSGVDPDQLQGHHLGFAGFDLAIKKAPHDKPRIASFLGASYFRAVDKAMQYGLSARGLAIDTDEPGGEEFPQFTEYWFVRPAAHSDRITVYALLDSKSATGAFAFDIAWGGAGTTMAITSEIHTRKAIKRLGIAPMSSMFLKGAAQPRARDTIYPRMHDSSRLSMWRGNGEWVCRPLYNPPTIQYNAFEDHSPHGFGLVQYDHNFADYRDPVVRYDQRPSLWVKPKNDWGQGAVALLEMPTVGETTDNIVAFWVPKQPVKAGQTLHYDYTLYWFPEPPAKPSLAAVSQTRTGMGNVQPGWIPGDHSPQKYARRFAIDFTGKPLRNLAANADVQAKVSASRGQITHIRVRKLEPINQYRAEFDWQPESESTEPITLRCYLQSDAKTLTETWLYQWVPPKPDARHY
jgi:glucan biosynthesis protein